MAYVTNDLIETEINTLFNAFGVGEEMQLDRFSSLEFTQSDISVMVDMGTRLAAYKQEIDGAFSSYLHSTYKNTLLSDPIQAEQLLTNQIANIYLLTSGHYNDDYIRSRYAIGITHRTLGLPFNQLIADYSKYKVLLRPVIWRFCDGDIYNLINYMEALSRIMYFDIGIALDAYCQGEQFALIQIQQEYSNRTEQLIIERNYDNLTGLPNRQFFKNQLVHLLQIAENKSLTVAMIKLGLDKFKALNDREGYETGDLALKEIGTRLQSFLQKDDLVAYWGGASFTIALTNLDQTQGIDRVCNEICTLVSKPLETVGDQIVLTCTMGIALSPNDAQSANNLIKYSDNAMILAKEMGGNKFQFFNKRLDARLNERLSIANEISAALDANQFCLHYQPVADLQSGDIVSMEALIRWNHPTRGMMQPAQFIDIAEEFSFINLIGNWVIRQACRDIQQWRAQGISMPRIAINVSPKQLLEPGFIKHLLMTLTDFDIKPQMITLEITESTLIHHSAGMEKLLKELKANKISLSMDDFGTGYSALQYLKHYPFDYVKIDQSFVRNILDNSNDAAIASAVIAMAHSMGIKVIAEGVETELQCQYFSQSMCDQIQGYYLALPMPPDKAGDYIASKFTLPEHLRRLTKKSRTLLLVDDEANILASLKRLFRQDGYNILTADSGAEGLAILKTTHVDVIMSDQRMPNMTGVEFLRQAKVKYPATVRIVLSGYTELQSITDAINEGSIYKFLTKPWDDEQLRFHISEAFMQKEMFDENRQLGIKIQTANQELASANRQLADILQVKEKQLHRDETSLDIAREALQYLPIPMLGIDDDGMIAFANTATEELLFKDQALLGADVEDILPAFNSMAAMAGEGVSFSLAIPGFDYQASWRTMGSHSKSRGKIITFFAKD